MKQASSKRSREGFPDGPDTDFDVSTYYSTISSGVQAAVRLEELAGCAALRVDVAVSELLFAVSTVMASLSDARMQLVFTLRTLLRVRGKALDHALEELDGCEKQLLACARVCAAGGMYDPHLAWESANGSISLISYDTFPRVSLFVDPGLFASSDACTVFTACVRVSDGELGPARSLWGGSGLKYCELGTAPSASCHNKVTLLCVDALGDRLRGLRPDHFHVSIKVEGAQCDASVKDVTVKDDVLEFAYSVSNAAEEAAPTGGVAGQVTITVLCFGALITSPAIPVSVL